MPNQVRTVNLHKYSAVYVHTIAAREARYSHYKTHTQGIHRCNAQRNLLVG